MILDTTLLVDLQRELRRNESGPASQLLGRLQQTEVCLAFVTPMEFAEGFADDQREKSDKFLAPFRVLWPDADTVWTASRVSRSLSVAGRKIGDHDAWIAALALQHQMPVVTRNEEHFRRVGGLVVQSY